MSDVARQIGGGWPRAGSGCAIAIKLLTGIVFCNLAFGQSAGSKTPGGPVCPLSDEQTRKSIEAFAKIAKFITTEPRCFNCHGGVNPYIDGTGPDPEDPEAPPSLFEHFTPLDRPADKRFIDLQCRECHSNTPRRAIDGEKSLWMIATYLHAFVGKDATALCKQLKQSSGGDAKHFIGHLENDNGGNAFTEIAFNGDRALDRHDFPESKYPTKKPSISHAAFVKMGRDWVDATGGEFKGDSECGCVPSHYSIRLTTHVEHRMGGISSTGGLQVDIPITFADDGSFSGQGTATIRGQGTMYGMQMQSAGNVFVLASGHATETAKEQSMHLQLDEGSPVTVNGTVTVRGRTVSGGSSQWGRAIPPFDLKGNVGESIDKPIAQLPGLVSTMHLEIVKRDEKAK